MVINFLLYYYQYNKYSEIERKLLQVELKFYDYQKKKVYSQKFDYEKNEYAFYYGRPGIRLKQDDEYDNVFEISAGDYKRHQYPSNYVSKGLYIIPLE